MDQHNNNNNNNGSNNSGGDKYKNWYEIKRDFERGGERPEEHGRQEQSDWSAQSDRKEKSDWSEQSDRREQPDWSAQSDRQEDGVSYFRYGSMPDNQAERPALHDAIELTPSSENKPDRGEDGHSEQVEGSRSELFPSTPAYAPAALPYTQQQQQAYARHDATKASAARSHRPARSSWKSMFASFMAGVVVVGSLMFVSDRFDLFTADQGVFNSPPASEQSAPPSGNGLQNTSLEVVRPNTIAEIARTSTPAVVKIETYSKATQRSRSGSMFDDPFFNFFFGDQGRGSTGGNSGGEGTLVQTGTGSGFLFDPDGYILTNQHVLEGADEIRVFIEGYSDYFVAEQLGDSFDLDLAALKISGKEPFPYLQLGDADSLNVGDWVVAIGNPYGFDHTVTVGVLSAKERAIPITDSNGTRNYKNLLQTDASINPGNSGGPLLNLNGEVIGINTAVNSQAQGIGFAIPTSTVSVVLDNLKNDTPIPKEPAPYIGVYIGNVDADTAEQLEYKGTDGAIVSQVELRSPAHLAGLQNWDIITGVNGEKIKTSNELTDKIKTYSVGDTVKLNVFRLGQTLEINVTIGDRNATSN